MIDWLFGWGGKLLAVLAAIGGLLLTGGRLSRQRAAAREIEKLRDVMEVDNEMAGLDADDHRRRLRERNAQRR